MFAKSTTYPTIGTRQPLLGYGPFQEAPYSSKEDVFNKFAHFFSWRVFNKAEKVEGLDAVDVSVSGGFYGESSTVVSGLLQHQEILASGEIIEDIEDFQKLKDKIVGNERELIEDFVRRFPATPRAATEALSIIRNYFTREEINAEIFDFLNDGLNPVMFLTIKFDGSVKEGLNYLRSIQRELIETGADGAEKLGVDVDFQ